MVHKYGLPLTDSDWPGLPLRVGHFDAVGGVEDLQGHSDGILLWSGGISEVTLDSSCASDKITRTTFTRRDGMIDLLPQGTTLHQVRWLGDATSCVSVSLPAGTRQQLLGADAPAFSPELGPQLGVLDEHLGDLVRRLQAQITTGLPLGAAYVQGISLSLAAYVSSRYCAAAAPSRAPAALGKTLPPVQREAVAAFVEQNLASNLGLIDLASVVGYSPDHFARLFKAAFGVTPHQYLLARRVEHAKRLLREQRLSIAEVATLCGFANQPHLNVVFKRATGTTPAAYRRG